MIAGTYILSGILLIITGILFRNATLTATTQTVAWCVIFFFASAGASAAYLTVSEIFPMETRAMAIAFFYAIGTIVGGFGGPLLFGALIQTGEPDQIFIGYLVGAIVMIIGGVIQATMGVEAAQRDLEDIAPPLSAQGEELEEPGEEADPHTVGRFGRSENRAPVESGQTRVGDDR
jgi:MFS family permease